jgi:hypothetical protein
MKNYVIITKEDSLKLLDAFSDLNEMDVFFKGLSDLMNEHLFNSMMMSRVDQDTADSIFLKQICMFSMFCRDNIELIHQLVKNLNVRPMTEDEIQQLKQEGCPE